MKTASRIGPIVTVIVMLVLDVLLPGRYRVAPPWLLEPAVGLMLIPMIAVMVTHGNELVRRVERAIMGTAISLFLILNVINLLGVVSDVVFHPDQIQPGPLVGTAVMLWVANMLIFSLLYWEIDRGGPDARIGDATHYADFDFPADGNDKAPPGWRPGFFDYLFIGFTTNTAFSPTEAMPLTGRAKALVMLQSSISLITIVIVAARAINILK